MLGAQFVPTDGHIDPTGLTLSFAAGAKAAGAGVRTGVRVEEITVRDGRVTGVVTDHGAIEAEFVVNAGGIWAHELGRLAGVEIPVVPMEHQYLITRPIEGVRADFPTLRDPDNLVYVEEEVGGLVVGGYERNPDPWHVTDPIPSDFNHRLLPEKWERFESIADGAFRLIPPLQTTEINRFINGPEAFTPDDDFILGETEVAGFFVAAGFCAHGVTGAAGIGRWTAEWIVEGEPSMDLSKMDIRRFGRQYRSATTRWRRPTRSTRSTTTSGTRARRTRRVGRSGCPRRTDAWRSWTPSSARRPAGSERTGSDRTRTEPTRTGGRAAGPESSGRPRSWPSTWPSANEPRCSTRRASRSSRSRVPAPSASCSASARTTWTCGSDASCTQMLNGRGGIESDLTVARLGDERFRLVTGTASEAETSRGSPTPGG